MAAEPTTPTPNTNAKIDFVTNAKPKVAETGATKEDDMSSSTPKLTRENTSTSFFNDEDEWFDNTARPSRATARRPVRPIARRHSRSPVPINTNTSPIYLTSSTQLLANIATYDGVADLPFPARGGVYLTMFPFTDRDVKKWAWLFSAGVEDAYLANVSVRVMHGFA